MTECVINTRPVRAPREEAAGLQPPPWLDLPEPRSVTPKQKFRTIWISDIHLGTSGCNATLLLDFLANCECETLYLTGDIIDGWRLKKGWY